MRHRIDLLYAASTARCRRFNPDRLLMFAEMVAGQDRPIVYRPAASSQPERRAGHTAADVCRKICRASPGTTSCPRPSATCPACGRMRVDIGTDGANNSTIGERALSVVRAFCPASMPALSSQPPESQSQRHQALSGPGVRAKPALQPDPEQKRRPEPTPTPTQASAGPSRSPRPAAHRPSQSPQMATCAQVLRARGSDAARADPGAGLLPQLYELERAAKDFSDAQRLQMRQDPAAPILAGSTHG